MTDHRKKQAPTHRTTFHLTQRGNGAEPKPDTRELTKLLQALKREFVHVHNCYRGILYTSLGLPVAGPNHYIATVLKYEEILVPRSDCLIEVEKEGLKMEYMTVHPSIVLANYRTD